MFHLGSSFFNMTVVISRPLFGFVSLLRTSLVTTDKFTSLQIIGIRREGKSLAPFYDTATRKSPIARIEQMSQPKI